MSTTVLVASPTKVIRTGSIILTPSKRKRNTSEKKAEARTPILTPAPPTHKEIFSWTFTANSVASCHVRDVYEMKGAEHEGSKGPDFYWLGRVPCRSVRVVGLVVGVGVSPKKIVYTVDDGTGVVDCNQSVSVAKQRKSDTEVASKAPPLPELPTPVANVGEFLLVVGKINKRQKDGGRYIVADQIERCSSANEELLHYQRARELHQTNYSLSTPFVIPEVKVEQVPTTPHRNNTNSAPKRPVIPQSSPATSVATASPAKSDRTQASPHKLRHPSRLHSADLTANAFRIYVKHFMDNDPQETLPEDDPFRASIPHAPSTPTKRSKPSEDDATPRPSRHLASSRIHIEPLIFSGSSALTSGSNPEPARIEGYTVSYLRRVPELALLAKRVLRQELRLARKKMKDAPQHSSSKSRAPPSKAVDSKPSAKDVKRLFARAVTELYQEGSIVIWDGPKRKFLDHGDEQRLQLWNANASSASADTTAASSIFGQSRSGITLDLDDDDLSDPHPNEEAYISLKVPYLADRLAELIPRVKCAIQKATAVPKPYLGASNEGLLQYMRRDDRWRHVRLDSVDDALAYLKEEGRVWCPRSGQWDLTL